MDGEWPDRLWTQLIGRADIRSPWAEMELRLLEVKGLGARTARDGDVHDAAKVCDLSHGIEPELRAVGIARVNAASAAAINRIGKRGSHDVSEWKLPPTASRIVTHEETALLHGEEAIG